MFRFLNKVFGAAVAFLFYPLKSAIISVLILVATLLLAFPALIFLPILIAHIAAEDEEGFMDVFLVGLGFWLIAGMIIFVIMPAILFLALAAVVGLGLYDLFQSALLGLQEGFAEGLFFHVFDRLLFDLLNFNTVPKIIRSIFNGSSNNEVLNEEKMNALWDKTEYEKFIPLSESEINSARKNKECKERLSAYEDLYSRLTDLDLFLKRRTIGDDEITDGIASIEDEDVTDEIAANIHIDKPALLVKQYLDASGKWWHAIPKLSRIIDGPTHTKWLTEHNKTHMGTREPIDNASLYKGRPARYRLREYKDMNDAQELIELSLSIREQLNPIPKPLAIESLSEPTVSWDKAEKIFSHLKNDLFQFFSVANSATTVNSETTILNPEEERRDSYSL